jgi:hypothetical protein
VASSTVRAVNGRAGSFVLVSRNLGAPPLVCHPPASAAEARGICFPFFHETPGFEDSIPPIQDALNNCQRLLVILSPSSVSSTNVEDEVAFALEEHKTVIPVFYRDCKVPFQLRPFQYVDFKTDYDRGLKTLLRTLGGEQQSAAAGGRAASAEPKDTAAHVSDAHERERAAASAAAQSDAKRKADEEKARQMEFEPKRLDRKKTPTPAPVRDAVRQKFPLWAKGGVAIFALIVVGALVYWASLGSNPKQPVVEPQKQEAKSETRAPATTTPQVSIEQQAPPPPSVAANAESSRPKTITQAKPGRFFEVIVRAKDSAWVSIKADGKITVRGIINPTDVKTVHATEQIVFWTGNAGGVEVSFNGRPVPITGGPNEELLLEFNSHGLVSPPAADVKKPAARNCPEGPIATLTRT